MAIFITCIYLVVAFEQNRTYVHKHVAISKPGYFYHLILKIVHTMGYTYMQLHYIYDGMSTTKAGTDFTLIVRNYVVTAQGNKLVISTKFYKNLQDCKKSLAK